MNSEDLHNLAYFGANVVDEEDSKEPVSARELVATIVRVLDQPNARLVGAVLHALLEASSRGDGSGQLTVDAAEEVQSRPDASSPERPKR